MFLGLRIIRRNKGWKTHSLYTEYLRESRVINALPNGAIRYLYADSCRIHNSTQGLSEALDGVRTVLHRFSANCPSNIQLLDQFFSSYAKVNGESVGIRRE